MSAEPVVPPEPLNDQADDLLQDVREMGHLKADFHRRAWAILEALAALKYSEVAAVAVPALPAPEPPPTEHQAAHGAQGEARKPTAAQAVPVGVGDELYPSLSGAVVNEPLGHWDADFSKLSPDERLDWAIVRLSGQGEPSLAVTEARRAVLRELLRRVGAALPAEHAPPEPSADDPGRTLDLILIAGTEERFGEEPDLDRWREIVESWTPEQRDQVENFCGAIHLRASDNDDVIVPSRPVILDQLRGSRPALAGSPALSAATIHEIIRRIQDALPHGEHSQVAPLYPTWEAAVRIFDALRLYFEPPYAGHAGVSEGERKP